MNKYNTKNQSTQGISRVVIEAEQEFLANLLSAIGDKPDEAVINRYGKEAEKYFVDDGHRLIFRTMLTLAEQNKAIDCVAIAQILLDSKQLGAACSIDKLTDVQDKSSYSLPQKVRITCADEQLSIMHDFWTKRQMRRFADRVN